MTVPGNGVSVIDCVEYGYVDIDTSLWVTEGHQTKFSSEIDGRDILRATFKKGVLRLQATSYVGVISLNDHVVVRVKPRVPIANLTRMVIETGHSVLPLTAFRDYSTRGTADDWAMDVYTDALLSYVDDLLDAGLLRAYERREGEGHLPHGRVDFTRTVQRFAARSVSNKAAYSWFERTVDTPVNRCVRAAMNVVHQHLTKTRSQPRRGDRSKAARLAGQFHAFEEVSDDPGYRFLEDAQVLGLAPLPDPRAYYRPVLDLSVAILRGVGLALDLGGSDVQLGSLLIDTNKLFENFVRVSLAKHAAAQGWPVAVLDGNTDGKVDLYDVPVPLPAPFGTPMRAVASRDAGKAQPDVVLKTLDGRFPLIAEVKNTIHGAAVDTDTLPDRDEVEQAVTYALRYGLSFTLLIHPWIRGSKGLLYVGRVRSIDVYDYRLDLSSDTRTDAALADMARVVAGLARLTIDQAPTSG
ncbi:McrC family protein [Blastococcus sp. LR1]|uniref:McrC family protein n=1 Tax=Blastococcus sp. LR1 TaxID=2877000 RepID=UPI001CCBEA4C|nr:McrC family protein [Blastococcus sp. LR1]MCA0146759.1 McrC family protein [Blastococcus sp. LR1]